ncbi:MAG: hypothetical protein NVSMB31_17840 [Vulcanimicrobiaceae bacterium]
MNIAQGEQLDQFGLFNSLGALSKLQALSPNWFRIHAGADTTPAVLPEVRPIGVTAAYDFSELDKLSSVAYQLSGSVPILNVRYAPRSLWTNCAPFFAGNAGTLRDTTFNEFADYMARLVSYYNTGSMTDGAIVRVNPSGTAHRIAYWEIWNEPDLSDETPCTAAGGGTMPALSSAQYVAMWNVVTAKMLAVDPSLKFLGPATSTPITGQIPDYVPILLQNIQNRLPDAISTHAYGGSITATDGTLINGSAATPGLSGMLTGLAQNITWIRASSIPNTPLFIDETNVTPDSRDDSKARPWTSFGAAFGAAFFERVATLGAPAVVIPFQFVEPGFQLAEINFNSGQPLLTYWRQFEIAQSFPTGCTMLPITSDDASLEVLAARLINGSIRLMVINAQPASPSDIGGVGVAKTVQVSVGGMSGVSSAHLWLVDALTPLATGPVTQTLPAARTITFSFSGYGAAFLELVP